MDEHRYCTEIFRIPMRGPGDISGFGALLMSGGTEGVLGPHAAIFARVTEDACGIDGVLARGVGARRPRRLFERGLGPRQDRARPQRVARDQGAEGMRR